jgi:peptidyl-prolyl cis-trans isomerase B (cyclophilin B)
VASNRERERRLERERAQRRIARQAHRARQKRQIYAGVSAGLALILIILGVTWALGGFKGGDPNVISGTCTWRLRDVAANPSLTDVGHPPATGEKRDGTDTMTIVTSLGEIQAVLDLHKTPCTASSFKYLGEKGFFANSTCYRLSTNLKYLACGDPRGDGSGGPGYSFADEDVPTTPVPGTSTATPTPTASATASASAAASQVYYPKGTIVLSNSGKDTNGSLFYIVYGDGSTLGPSYSIVGTIVKGLDIIENVAKGGAADSAGKDAAEGTPKTSLMIQALTVGTPATPTPTAGTSTTPTSSAAPTPTSQS